MEGWMDGGRHSRIHQRSTSRTPPPSHHPSGSCCLLCLFAIMDGQGLSGSLPRCAVIISLPFFPPLPTYLADTFRRCQMWWKPSPPPLLFLVLQMGDVIAKPRRDATDQTTTSHLKKTHFYMCTFNSPQERGETRSRHSKHTPTENHPEDREHSLTAHTAILPRTEVPPTQPPTIHSLPRYCQPSQILIDTNQPSEREDSLPPTAVLASEATVATAVAAAAASFFFFFFSFSSYLCHNTYIHVPPALHACMHVCRQARPDFCLSVLSV
ncbi:hypothetical protein F4778DRAFT_742408 [Xylariomycetidae sp. FL2044]|nr:hypothetical protein F4778DRAFT_742408 [Xylariomycetidae sp. FL2044]